MLRVCVALALYWTVVVEREPPTTLTSERLKQEDGGYECSSAINSFVGTMQRFSSWSLFCYFLLIDRSTQTKYCIKIKWNPGLFPVFVLIWCFWVCTVKENPSVQSPLLSLRRHYFVSSPYLASNPGEQFYMFTIIAAWLINVAGRPFTEPQEYDEPNATVSNILAELRAFVSHTERV